MKTILISHTPSALANYFGPKALARLQAVAQVRLKPDEAPWTMEALVDSARGCEVIIADRSTAGPAELFPRLPRLVAFSRCAVDIRNIDVATASREGILVTQASAGFMASVSEWIVGVMIDLARHLSAANAEYHAGRLPVPAMGRELRGATLGVIGYGQIARYLCRLGQAFGMRILVSDPFARIDDPALVRATQPDLLAQSDFVVCLAVATDATENLMDAAAFAAMKPTAFFINASRGGLVDEAALVRALDDGVIAGCALDVGRAPDQMPSPALARHPRVIATPHVGGLTPPAIEHQALETADQVLTILRGEVPVGAVNAAQAARLRAMQAAGDVASTEQATRRK